jgi:ABC-type amino acid transport substrate-binding protein
MKLAQIMTVVFVACILVSAIPASAATMNYKLGVQSGTTSDTYAAAELANAEVSAFDSIDLAIEALKQGDVDFVLGDLPTLKFYQADSDGLSIAGSFSEEDFGIGVAPGEADLLAAINMALGEIIASGEYDTIFAASFGDEIVVLTDDTDANTATAYPENATGALAAALDAGTLAFGTDPYYPPFESYDTDNTTMVGFDVDMANAIAAKIGAAYNNTNFTATMVEKTWDELLAFGYDNYDATLSAMTKTAQRAENTDFSRAYYSSKQGILASADSPTISGVSDLNGTYEVVADADTTEEDDSPSITVLASALAIGLIAVSRRKN